MQATHDDRHRCAQNADHFARNSPFSALFSEVVCTLGTTPPQTVISPPPKGGNGVIRDPTRRQPAPNAAKPPLSPAWKPSQSLQALSAVPAGDGIQATVDKGGATAKQNSPSTSHTAPLPAQNSPDTSHTAPPRYKTRPAHPFSPHVRYKTRPAHPFSPHARYKTRPAHPFSPHVRYKTRPAHPFSPHVRYKTRPARSKWLFLACFARAWRTFYRFRRQQAVQGELSTAVAANKPSMANFLPNTSWMRGQHTQQHTKPHRHKGLQRNQRVTAVTTPGKVARNSIPSTLNRSPEALKFRRRGFTV